MGLLSTFGAASGRAFGLTRLSAAIKDAYFNLTTLLLPGNGTNGAQNNTFLDSSTNNFTITRNGNTTQGTFSPFSQTGWSNYLNGSSYFNAGTSLFNYTTGNASTTTFTIEAFVYLNSYQTTANSYHNPCIIGKGDVYLNLGVNGSGNLVFYHYDGSARTITGSSVIPKNTWTYVAVRVTGGTATLYVGSSSDGSGTWYGIDSAGQNTSSLIGRASTNASSLYFDGYIASLRVSTTARTISVPTAAYSNDANTALLVCQSNRFFDQSSNAYSLTITGSPSVQAFSPFAPTAAYSAATNGASGYWDGTGDYLSVGTAANWTFLHNSTAKWTMEFWVYNNTAGTNTTFFDTNNSTTGSTGVTVQKTSSEFINVFITYSSAGNNIVNGTSTVALRQNAWNHVFISYDQTLANTNLVFYINGVAAGTANKTANTPSSGNPANALSIGCYGAGGGQFFPGYIGSARISNVVRSVPSGVPTAPYTSDANTSLLLNFTNGGIIDATGKNVLETVGNAQISTTQSKWGGSSLYFDGTNDALVVSGSAASPLFKFSGDFTVEGWFYLAGGSGTRRDIVHYDNGASNGFGVFVNTTNVLWAGVNATYSASSSTPSLSTWYHFALVRSGTATNNCKLYVDGTQVLQFTDTSAVNPNVSFYVGATNTLDGDFNGYVDDLRVSRYARYTANFTAPTAAFALQ